MTSLMGPDGMTAKGAGWGRGAGLGRDGLSVKIARRSGGSMARHWS
jgi:hypothetical protein